MIPKIQPCLWFDGNAEEAARFYADTFPDTRIGDVMHAPGDYPYGKKGDVLTVEMTILGMPFLLLNGGPQFKFDEAVSFQVATDDQAETDRYWNAITKQRWRRERVRLVQGSFRPVLADHAETLDRAHHPRRRNGVTRVQRHDGDAEDRHRRARSGGRGRQRLRHCGRSPHPNGGRISSR